MFTSSLIAFFVLAVPPGDGSAGVRSSHLVPRHGGHGWRSSDGAVPVSGVDGMLSAAWSPAGLQTREPEAALVTLQSLEPHIAAPHAFLASSDRPRYWTAVPFGRLRVEVHVPATLVETTDVGLPEYLVLFLDGKPVETRGYPAGPQPSSVPLPDGRPRMAYAFEFPCPAPGKHIVQARYKHNGLWSRISAPLHFEVRLPDPPQIIAIADGSRTPEPIGTRGLISISQPTIGVRLADVSQDAQVLAYLNGKPVDTALAAESCCRTISLLDHLTPGVHSLRVRTVASSELCSVTSEPSAEVIFHYHSEEIYLLRPSSRCPSGRPTSAARIEKEQGDRPVASPNLERRAANAFEIKPASTVLAGFTAEDPKPTVETEIAQAVRVLRKRTITAAQRAAAQAASAEGYVGRAGAVAEQLRFAQQARERAEQHTYNAAKCASTVTTARLESASANHRARMAAQAAELNALAAATSAKEWSQANARIDLAHAEDSLARAQAVQGPPSPYFFASAAHFPLPGYGPRGERVDRKGLVIYEDMEFRFDSDGNYEVHFRASQPELPVVVELQFHIQPRRGGAWYTVTLPPIDLQPSGRGSARLTCQSNGTCTGTTKDKCCGEVRKCVCRGRSEILRRCYGEMGQDALIRRTGTARFGYGIDVLRQAAAF
jgi:hypothetical protein